MGESAKQSNTKQPKNRGGAPRGNQNARKHGKHSKQQPVVTTPSSHGGKRKGSGAKPDNQNAVTHGVNSQRMTPEDLANYQLFYDAARQAAKRGDYSLEHEIALSRVRVARAISIDRRLRDAEENGQHPRDYLSVSEWECGASGERTSYKSPDIFGVIDRTIGRTGSLVMKQARLAQMPTMTAQQQIFKSEVYDSLQRDEITAIQAGRLLEGNGIKVGAVLLSEVRAELKVKYSRDAYVLAVMSRLDRERKEKQARQQQLEVDRNHWIQKKADYQQRKEASCRERIAQDRQAQDTLTRNISDLKIISICDTY